MTIQEAVDRILNYHPHLSWTGGSDGFKCGNPEDECTGIVTAMTASVEVVRRTAALGANLLVVHEPTNYTSSDRPGWYEDFGNAVFGEKKRLLEENGIAVWRDHDRMHMHSPDGIFTGVLRYLGWEAYAEVDASMGKYANFVVTLPEEISLQALLAKLAGTIGMNGIRYIGPRDMPVRKPAIVGHLEAVPEERTNHAGFPKEYSVELIRYFEEEGVDVILPGETIDWTLLSYVRDSLELGLNRAVIPLGHFNWEELGMRYAAEWVRELMQGEVPVHYVPAGDMYRFFL